MIYDPDILDWALTMLRFFGGKEVVLGARLRAMEDQTVTTLRCEGLLLGGKLEVSITFDGRKTSANEPNPLPA